MTMPAGRDRGYITNPNLASLVRRVRRNYAREDLQKIFRAREDEDMFIRIGLAARNESAEDIGRLSPVKRQQLAWSGYEIASNSPQCLEHMTAQY